MRAAAVQLNSTDDKARNLAAAERLVRAAAADGAELVALPEKWNLLAGGEELLGRRRAARRPEPDRRPRLGARARHPPARRQHLRARAGEKAFNTSVLIGPDGDGPRRLPQDPHVRRRRRRRRLPRVRARGAGRRRSSPRRSASSTLGLSVCYDLRFPELYRILAVRGARLLTVPSAFTLATGRDHWEVLLRARAIENQAFVLAPNQVGEAPPHFSSYGRSAIVDPWGVVLATAPDGECFVAADLDLAAQDERARVAALARQPPPAGLRLAAADGGARLMAESTADRQAPPDPRRRDPRLRPPGLPLDPRLRHRRRGRGRLRPRLPLLQVQGRGAQRALQRALVAAAGARSRRPTASGEHAAREARRGRRLHRRLLPPRPGADEGDHRRGHPRRQLLRPHPPAGDPPRLRLDRQDRRRRPGGGRLPRRHRPRLRLDVLLRRDRAAALRLDLRGDPGLRRRLRPGKGACGGDDLRRARAAIGKVASRYGQRDRQTTGLERDAGRQQRAGQHRRRPSRRVL